MLFKRNDIKICVEHRRIDENRKYNRFKTMDFE